MDSANTCPSQFGLVVAMAMRWVAGEAAYLKEAAHGLKRPYNELRRDHRLDSTRSLVCFGKIADRSLCTDNVFNYGT